MPLYCNDHIRTPLCACARVVCVHACVRMCVCVCMVVCGLVGVDADGCLGSWMVCSDDWEYMCVYVTNECRCRKTVPTLLQRIRKHKTKHSPQCPMFIRMYLIISDTSISLNVAGMFTC